jgi:hypothetical protein
MTSLRLAALAALVPTLIACGSSDDSTGETDPGYIITGPSGTTPTGTMTGPAGTNPVTPGTPGCDPNAEIPCIEGIAEPCEGINSGYDGDEFCRAAPDPSLGMQIHIGPDDYSDPAQVEPYLIYAGEETNWAEVAQFPNTTDVYTRGYRSYMRPGSHHFIMFGNDQGTVSGPMENGGGAEAATGIGGRFLGGATKAIQNIDTQTEYPEDQGIGTRVPANSFVAMNLHFVNPTDHALIQEIWVNFIYIPQEEVTQYVKPITWYGGIGMNIPPGTHTVLSNAATSCTAPADLRIGMMTAHAHASTLRVTTKMNNSTLLFEDYDWAEPTEWRYSRAIENPAPDPATFQSGGYNGLLNAMAGDSFQWECEVNNRTTSYLTFSNRVYDGEMCNVFGYYITPNVNSANWTCAFF